MDSIKYFLDIDDEITFISEKIISSESNKIILIVPEGALILSSLPGLKLLNRLVSDNNKNVIIVSMDNSGRTLASKAGFITKNRVGEVDELTWSEKELNDENKNDIINKNNSEEYDEENSNKDYNVTEEEEINDKSFENNSKYVEPVKIIKLDDFDLVIGGDAAIIKSSKQLEKVEVAKKKNLLNILHSDESIGIVGNDLEAKSTKKIKKKIIKDNMVTKDNIKLISKKSKKYFKKWMIIPIICIFLISVILFIIFIPTAVIDVSMKSEYVSKAVDIKANTSINSVNSTLNEIPAYSLDVSETFSSSLNTTGKKDFGSKATGTVIIYNSTSNSISIPKGTVFITNDANAYNYTLDADMNIPAAITAPQSEVGNLTASNFGTDYNIPAKTQFSIKLSILPTTGIISSANTSFQGGTSSSAKVVSQSDQDNLLKSLQQQLYSKGSDDIKSKINSGENLISDSINNQVITKTFDSAVGDKADVLNLTLVTKTSELFYKQDDIDKFSSNLLSSDLSSNQSIKNIISKVTYKSFSSSNGDILLNINSNAQKILYLDTSAIIANTKMRTVGSSESYIHNLNGVNTVSIKVSPGIYGFLRIMPFRESNIKVNILAK